MTNFKTIIVPEALKGIQNEEESVKDITKALHDLIIDCPMSLQTIVERLQSTEKEKVVYLFLVILILDALRHNYRKFD